MNNYIDITKTGTSGLKGLSFNENPTYRTEYQEELHKKLEQLQPHSVSDYSAQSLDNLWEPTPIAVGQGYGTSKYDKGIMTIDEAQNIEAMRGEQQSAAAQWLHGITKGGVLAGTTFLQGTLGTIYGLGDMALNIGNKNESGWETFSRIWDNDFNDGVEEINQYMEKILPNYRTLEEQNRKWYQNLGTANFWADTILKQVGFTVGSFYSGRVFTGGLRALGMLSKSPAATAAQILYGSFSEGAIEANRNSGDWLNLQTAKINDTREQLKLEIEKQYGDSQGSWIMDQNGNLISEKQYKLNQIDSLADEEIQNQKKNASQYGLMNLLGSAISTGVADFITYGKMIVRGYESASNMAKKSAISEGIQKQFEKQATDKFSDNIAGKIGQYTWNKIPTKRGIYSGIKGASAQGFEEMNQQFAANFSGEFQEYDSPNAYYEALTNPDAELETKKFFTAATNGFINSYGNKDQWEQFAAAFITSIFGMPTFGRGNNSSDQTYLGNGKLVGLSGGIGGEIRENNIVNKYGEETVAYLNQYMQKFKDDADYFIQNQAFTDIMHGWSNTTNAFEYKNFEDNSDFVAINRYASVGKLEDLKEFVNTQYESLSDEEIAKIGDQAKPESENTNVDGSPKTSTKKGIEEIRKELIDKRDKILNNIDSYEKSIRQVRTLLPINIDKDKESELAWLLWKINRMDERFSEIKKDTRSYRVVLNNKIEEIKKDLDLNSENEQNKKDAEVQLNNLQIIQQMLSNLEKSETSVDFANTILKSKPILEYLNADLFTTEDNTGGIQRYTLFDVLDMESIGIDNTRWQNEINKFNDIFKLASLSTQFNNTLKKYIEDSSAQTKNRQNIDNKNAKRNKEKSDKNISEAINNSTTSDNIARVLDGDINIPEVLDQLDNSTVEGSKIAADKLREISKMVDLKEEILSQVQDENLPVSSEIAEILLDQALRTSENIGQMLDIQSEAYNNMQPILERFGEDLDKGIITREEADEATNKAKEVIMVAISKIIDDSATETPQQEDTSKNAQSVKEEPSEIKDEGASVVPVNQPTVKEIENMQPETADDEIGTPDITTGVLESQQDKQQKEDAKINSINKNTNGKYDFWLSGISEYLMYPKKEERDVKFRDRLDEYSQEEVRSITAVWDYLDSKGAFQAVKNKKAKGEVYFTVDRELNNTAEDFIVLINNSEGQVIGALPGLKSSNVNDYEYLNLFIENVKKEYQEWESQNPTQVLYTTGFKSHISKNYIGRPIYTKENYDLNTIFPNGYLLGVVNKGLQLVGLPAFVQNVAQPLQPTFGQSFIVMPTSSSSDRQYVCVPFITKKFNEETKDTALGKELLEFLSTFKNINANTAINDITNYYKEGLFNRLSFLCTRKQLHLNISEDGKNLILKRNNKQGGLDTIFKVKLGETISSEIVEQLFKGFNGKQYGFQVCKKWTNGHLNGQDYNKMIGEVSYTNLEPKLYTTSNDFFSINPVGIDGEEIVAKDMRSTGSRINNQNVKQTIYINNITYYYNKNNNELTDIKGNNIQDDVLKAIAYTEIFSKKGIVDTPFGWFNTNTQLFENTHTQEETSEGQKSFSNEDTDLNKPVQQNKNPEDLFQISYTYEGTHDYFKINSWNKNIGDPRQYGLGWATTENGIQGYVISNGGRGDVNSIWFRNNLSEMQKKMVEELFPTISRIDDSAIQKILNIIVQNNTFNTDNNTTTKSFSLQDFNRREQKILSNLSEEDREYVLSNFEKHVISSKLRQLDNCFDYQTNTYNYSQLGYSDLKSFMEGTKLRKTDNLEYKKWNANREARWLHKVLPQLTFDESKQIVEGINGLIQAGNGVHAYGMFKNGLIYIGKNAAKGTMYHEAFHAVVNTLLSQEDKDTMFNEASKKYNGKPYMELEELLAEDFRRYVQYSEIPIIGNIVNIFRKLKRYIQKLRGNELFLDSLFYRINSGQYSNILPNNYKGTKLSDRGYTQEMQEIKDKAIADGTFMLAPNDKPTNLTERQWLHVRTKAFKEWFGDWVNPYMSNINISLDIDRESADFDGFGSMVVIELKDKNNPSQGKLVGTIPMEQQIKSTKDFKFTQYVDINSVAGYSYIEEEFRGKGFGKAAYWELGMWLSRNGSILRSAMDISRTEAATRVWQSLERDGFAKKVDDRYEFVNNSSKVVDENGEPLVVYHGGIAGIKTFDKNKLGGYTHTESAKLGFFFTSNRRVSETYIRDSAFKYKGKLLELENKYKSLIENADAEYDAANKSLLNALRRQDMFFEKLKDLVKRNTDKNYIPLKQQIADLKKENDILYNKSKEIYTSIRQSKEFLEFKEFADKAYNVANLFLENYFIEHRKDADIYEVFLNIKDPGIKDFTTNRTDSGKFYFDTIKEKINEGRDGVILTNVTDVGMFTPPNLEELFIGTDYVVFEPNQIKSATDNIGNYSRENDNIYYRKIENYYADKLRYQNLSEEDKSYLSQHNVPQNIYDSMTQTEKELLWHCRV